ncbi:GAF domain-containing sensor histidine kinase [Trinickia dinghuensis]|nr:GAF domain-containing sensor histidine kinase [Trinickia dinghuensis]
MKEGSKSVHGAQEQDVLSQLEEELADAHLLQEISSTLFDETAVQGLYERLLEAASRIMRSDFASMQRFHGDDGLELLASRGFPPEAAEHWRWVHVTSGTTCGATLRSRARVIATDLESHPDIGAAELAMFRHSGIRSVQSTPLLSRSGALLGVISTHWKQPHQPSERRLRLLDIIARQAADLIERTTAEEALRLRTRQLVEADKRKDEFLATLAHELRNPLAPIQNGLAVLKIGKDEAVPLVLPMMERQLAHMVRLIDDLLDVSRVSRGLIVLKRERIELRTVIESALETSRPLLVAAEHRLAVEIPVQPVWLDADLTRVAQVLSNVLNNAAKYTPRGGRIELAAESSGDRVVVKIRDTGIGISKAMLTGIFEMFAQAEQSMDRAQGGLGLGLSVAKRLIEMHAGTIEAQSDGPGQGSTFIIRLPIAQAHDIEAVPMQVGQAGVTSSPRKSRSSAAQGR